MYLFLVGIIEMVVAAAWTKMVAENRLLASGAVSFVNVLIWYFVIKILINDIDNPLLVIIYSSGCATGTMLMVGVNKVRKRWRK